MTGTKRWWVAMVVVLMASVLAWGAETATVPAASQPAVDFSFYTGPSDSRPYAAIPDERVHNVILMIGDGMGLGQVAAARIKAGGAAGRLHLDRLPVTGFKTTYAKDSLVTDSAAAATALATGQKTNNGMVSMLPDGSPLATILEAARDRGLATGVVTVCTPVHATPAAFLAHAPLRSQYMLMADQVLDSGVNVLFGSSGARAEPGKEESEERLAALAILGQAERKGYQVAPTPDALDALTGKHVLGLFPLEGPDAAEAQPSLARMTAKAIQLLTRSENGFFLMVEGSQIDWCCHSNQAEPAMVQVLQFDLAVREAADFAADDLHTLVIVTADHETGGMAVNGGTLDGKELAIGWTSGNHTAEPVPVYALGPHAWRLAGIHDNTEIAKLMAEVLGIKADPTGMRAPSPSESKNPPKPMTPPTPAAAGAATPKRDL